MTRENSLTDQLGDSTYMQGPVVLFFKRDVAAKMLDMTIQRLGFLLRSGRFPGAMQRGKRRDWWIPLDEISGFKRQKVGRKKKPLA